MATLLADIQAHPDAAAFSPGWCFGLPQVEVDAAAKSCVELALVESRGVRFETSRARLTEVREMIETDPSCEVEQGETIRRRHGLYVLSDRGIQWLSTTTKEARPRDKDAPRVPRHPRYMNTLARSPRDVFDLSEQPWRCKIPASDKETKDRVATFLATRRAERLSRTQDTEMRWIALDWLSPTAKS